MTIFLIYNLAGLLVGIAGFFVGLAAMLLAGRFSAGLVVMALTWLGLGLWWRRRGIGEGGTPRPYPALFFVPLPFASPVLLVLGLFAFVAENYAARNPADPRAGQLREDIRTLSSSEASGDLALSREVREMLVASAVPAAKAEAFHVFTRVGPGSVLVLVQAPNLKTFAESARLQLLEALNQFATEHPRLQGKARYIGIRGKVAFGIVSATGQTKTGTIVADTPLLAFYDSDKNAPENPANGAAKSGDQPQPAKSKALDDPVSKSLADLASRQFPRAVTALSTLRKMPPITDRRDEVIRSIEEAVANLQWMGIAEANEAVEVLIAWGEPAQVVPILAEMAVQEKTYHFEAAARGLGNIKDPLAAEALAKLLAAGDHRPDIIRSLQLQGESAEPFVLPLLKSDNAQIRDYACEVLASVGGEEALKALEQLPKVKPGESQAVERAIDIIQRERAKGRRR